jgi:hypothetical protein
MKYVISPIRISWLATAIVLSLGCQLIGRQRNAATDETAEVSINLTQIPGDVSCARITAAGTRTVQQSFDLMAGGSAALAMSGLLVGEVVFSAQTFSTACAAIPAGTLPGWVSDPLATTLAAGTVTAVTLVMHKNGAASVSLDFQDGADGGAAGPPPDAGSMCLTAATCPGTDTACSTRTCLAGQCGVSIAAEGSVCGTFNSGLCQMGTCLSGFVAARVGDGTAALSSAATAVFLELHTAGGVPLGSPIPLPTAANGDNQPLTLSGTSTAEGHLSLSADGAYLTLAGYASIPGTASVATTASVDVNRVVARIDRMGQIDTTTRLDAAFSGGSARSAASNDGTGFWVAGNGAPGGVFFVPFGGTTGAVQVLATPANVRVAGIAFGQLLASAFSGGFDSVFAVGLGLPNTMGQSATPFPGLPTAGASPGGFAVLDRNPMVAGADTIYVADDRTPAQGGGIQKWTFDGATFTLAATFSAGIDSGVRALGAVAGPGGVRLIATTAELTGNRIVSLVDDGSSAPAVTLLATAPTNTVYRGVVFAP